MSVRKANQTPEERQIEKAKKAQMMSAHRAKQTTGEKEKES